MTHVQPGIALNPLIHSGPPPWPFPRVHPWPIKYLAWDHFTHCDAVIVVPKDWGPDNPPPAKPLVISPHGRNNLGLDNATAYWQDVNADGQFILICPDGLGRAHSQTTDPFDWPPEVFAHPGKFGYGYPGEITDLARMPKIVEATLPWLKVDLDHVYVLGSSMGGQDTLLLAGTYPTQLDGGTGRLAGAAAFDAPCDVTAQCAYLTNLLPPDPAHPPAGTAALMLDEIGSKPADVSGFKRDATFYNFKTQGQMTIGQLLDELPVNQSLWDLRSPLSPQYVAQLSQLNFPLRLYWSSNDKIVANQETNQTGKLYAQIKAANPNADVTEVSGAWDHSQEFVPNDKLGDALRSFGLI